MPDRFTATDVAVARELRAFEAVSEDAIRASASLITTVVDASRARRLSAFQAQPLLDRVGGLITGALALRADSVQAHYAATQLGHALGLPLTSFGDVCQPAPQIAIGQDDRQQPVLVTNLDGAEQPTVVVDLDAHRQAA